MHIRSIRVSVLSSQSQHKLQHQELFLNKLHACAELVTRYQIRFVLGVQYAAAVQSPPSYLVKASIFKESCHHLMRRPISLLFVVVCYVD